MLPDEVRSAWEDISRYVEEEPTTGYAEVSPHNADLLQPVPQTGVDASPVAVDVKALREPLCSVSTEPPPPPPAPAAPSYATGRWHFLPEL